MFSHNIYNIEQIGNKITFLFKGSCQDAATCRQHIKNKTESYMIDQVTFFTNQSCHTEEDLAKRFGLLVPDQSDEMTGTLNITGPKLVMCSDIKKLSFIYDMPLVYLKENEQLHCQLTMKKGCGDMHQKWNPVSAITFCEIEYNVFKFNFELIGLLSWEDILKQL
jgi:hypothetical protein